MDYVVWYQFEYLTDDVRSLENRVSNLEDIINELQKKTARLEEEKSNCSCSKKERVPTEDIGYTSPATT